MAAPRLYRINVEDHGLDWMNEIDVYTSKREAMRAFHAYVAEPDPDWGSVYVTAQGPDDEWAEVIAGHSFPTPPVFPCPTCGSKHSDVDLLLEHVTQVHGR